MLNINKKSNLMGIIGALGCAIATGIGFGLSLPLLAFVMKNLGFSSFIIGLNTAMPAVAAFTMSPLFLRGIERLGLKAFMIVCLVMVLTCFWIFSITQNIFLWFILRFIFGAGLDGLFVASETWIGSFTQEHNRGRIMGLFSSCVSIGYFAGAGILMVSGTTGFLPFLVGSIIFLLNFIPLALSRGKIPNVETSESTPLRIFILGAPIAMAAAWVYGYLETSAFNLLPLYAASNGLSASLAVSLLVAVGLGQSCLQFGVGALNDKFGAKVALILCSVVSIVGTILLGIFIHQNFVLYPTLFFWGACISGFYTLALIVAIKQYKNISIAAANSAVVALFGLGSLVGPPIVGLGMEQSQRFGFIITMLIPVGIFLIFLGLKNIPKKPLRTIN